MKTHQGKCLCGAVTFSVSGDFEYAGYCHCTRCRAATGSAFSTFAAARTENLTITSGDAPVYERGKDNLARFCGECGSTLYYLIRNARYVHVQMGTLQGDPGIRPQFHCYVGSKAAWHEIGDTLPRFEELPPVS